MLASEAPWWRSAVMYQIYPRSFADSDGDGVGDIRGVISRLDYLQWLGIDAVWLNPVMPSPNADWGYDVSDYCNVHPELGTLADIDELVRRAGERGIRVIFDIVPNHTSDRHAWFKDALAGRDDAHHNYYVWADPKDGGRPPNNWRSVFGGPAWTYHEPSDQFYLHNFLDAQPDLDWWSDDVRKEFESILRFWFDRGVAGFRIDVAHALVKDRELRDNLPADENDHKHLQRIGQRQTYNMNRPEVHDVFKAWRKICDTYDPARILIGETFVYTVEDLASYYGTGADELDLAFNFVLGLGPFDPAGMRQTVGATEAALPRGAWPVYHGSNHDIGRFTTRWCADEARKARLATLMLLTLRGTAFLYYGDEIGMIERRFSYEEIKDPVGLNNWPENPGRDGCRTPMQWSPRPGAGFTAPHVQPWLPFGDYESTNVEAQRDDPGSHLNLTRALIRLRRSLPDLHAGDYERLDSPPGTWLYRRGASTFVVLNMGENEARFERVRGRVLCNSARRGEGGAVEGTITLGPWEGAVIGAGVSG